MGNIGRGPGGSASGPHGIGSPVHSLEGSSWSCPQPRSAPRSSLSLCCPRWIRRIPKSEWDQSVAGSFPTHLPEVHCPLPSALYASCLLVAAGTSQRGSEGGTLGGGRVWLRILSEEGSVGVNWKLPGKWWWGLHLGNLPVVFKNN